MEAQTLVIKKIAGILFIFLLTADLLHAQDVRFKNDRVKRYIDTTLLIIRNHALNRNNVNWDSLKADLYKKTKDANDIADIVAVYPGVFKTIDDHHGWLSYKNRNYRWNKRSERAVSNILKVSSGKYKEAYATLLNKKIGYIRIPGNADFGAKKMDSISANIAKEIDKVNLDKIEGWIVDLRLNTGGNMYPMIAGVHELIGNNEKIGGFIGSDRKSEGEWFLKNGDMYIDTSRVLKSTRLKTPVRKHLPVAVLISGYTASSGEMTAIAFIGRPKTKLIGEESAGYTTTNQGFKIDQDSGLNLAVGYVTDRAGKVYTDALKPDIEVTDGDDFETLMADKKIIEALKWLGKEKSK